MIEHTENQEEDTYRELRLLSEVQAMPETTQRHLATSLRISLGLTNLLVHNVVRKGYLRIIRAGWRRSLYALTPTGFSRKVQLTTTYIRRYLDHYRWVRQILREELEPLGLNAESRVALYGTGEFAELVYLALKELGIEQLNVFAADSVPSTRFLGMPVHQVTALKLEDYDRVVVGLISNDDGISMDIPILVEAREKLVTFFGNRGDNGDSH